MLRSAGVVGAWRGIYGRSRLREMILGGMTQDVLENVTMPVLMAH
ncbi:hypothetical protein [Azospirillum himalayense]|uniref:UspA domain-containing protein n=1 Tax=Azospirillum himalayense TaxID=654847 RepID=A0ABW0GA74_9PROT